MMIDEHRTENVPEKENRYVHGSWPSVFERILMVRPDIQHERRLGERARVGIATKLPCPTAKASPNYHATQLGPAAET
jgi:hypothetical protein